VSDGAREDDDIIIAWLLARDTGRPGPQVSDATAARYAQLEALLVGLSSPAAGVPRADWQERVLAAIGELTRLRAAPVRRARSSVTRRRTRSWH